MTYLNFNLHSDDLERVADEVVWHRSVPKRLDTDVLIMDDYTPMMYELFRDLTKNVSELVNDSDTWMHLMSNEYLGFKHFYSDQIGRTRIDTYKEVWTEALEIFKKNVHPKYYEKYDWEVDYYLDLIQDTMSKIVGSFDLIDLDDVLYRFLKNPSIHLRLRSVNSYNPKNIYEWAWYIKDSYASYLNLENAIITRDRNGNLIGYPDSHSLNYIAAKCRLTKTSMADALSYIAQVNPNYVPYPSYDLRKFLGIKEPTQNRVIRIVEGDFVEYRSSGRISNDFVYALTKNPDLTHREFMDYVCNLINYSKRYAINNSNSIRRSGNQEIRQVEVDKAGQAAMRRVGKVWKDCVVVVRELDYIIIEKDYRIIRYNGEKSYIKGILTRDMTHVHIELPKGIMYEGMHEVKIDTELPIEGDVLTCISEIFDSNFDLTQLKTVN